MGIFLRKHRRRHLERGVNPRVVVRVDEAVDLRHELPERAEAARVPELRLELRVEALLVPVLPGTPRVDARDRGAGTREENRDDPRVVLPPRCPSGRSGASSGRGAPRKALGGRGRRCAS